MITPRYQQILAEKGAPYKWYDVQWLILFRMLCLVIFAAYMNFYHFFAFQTGTPCRMYRTLKYWKSNLLVISCHVLFYPYWMKHQFISNKQRLLLACYRDGAGTLLKKIIICPVQKYHAFKKISSFIDPHWSSHFYNLYSLTTFRNCKWGQQVLNAWLLTSIHYQSACNATTLTDN